MRVTVKQLTKALNQVKNGDISEINFLYKNHLLEIASISDYGITPDITVKLISIDSRSKRELK